MALSDPIIVSKNYLNLVMGVEYRCICNDPLSNRALLVWFPSTKKASVGLTILSHQDFDSGLASGLISPKSSFSTLPPWHSGLEGVDLHAIEERRRREGRKRSNIEKMKARVQHIDIVLSHSRRFLAADDPLAELRAIVRSSKALEHLNPSRLVIHVLTYLAFDRNDLSVYPDFSRNGRWERDDSNVVVVVRNGALYRTADKDGKERCVNGFRENKKLGRTLVDVYKLSAVSEFDCVAATHHSDRGTNQSLMHPRGEWFPTYDQFRYIVHEALGKENVHLALYGASRTRRQSKHSKGRFSEAVAFYLEKIEFDAYAVVERPSPDAEGDPVVLLWVVRACDVATANTVGVGFSEGTEKAEAYFNAIFSMCIGLDETAALLGLSISPDFVPPKGLGPYSIMDRGTASTYEDIRKACGISELTPSCQGQSKATVETGHPKPRTIDDIRGAIQISLRAIPLAKRELLKAINSNVSKNVNHRLTPAMIDAGVAANPLSIARFLEGRKRTQAISIPESEAVRRFLRPVTLEAKEDGLYLHDQRYGCIAAARPATDVRRDEETLSTIPKGARVKAHAYCLSARKMWVEHEGRQIAIEPYLSLRETADQLCVPLSALSLRSKMMQLIRKEQRATASAADVALIEQFEQMTGLSWNAGTRPVRRGKKPRKRA